MTELQPRSEAAAWAARPGNEAALVEVIRRAESEGVAIRVLGAATDRRPICADADGWVELDTRGLDAVHAIDRRSCIVEVGAGATIARIQAALAAAELTLAHLGPLPADATVGGLLSRPHVWPATFGHPGIVEAVIGMTAWAASDRRYHYLPAPRKASGPDLRHVFVGAEGRNGVIARVWLAALRAPTAAVWFRADLARAELVPLMRAIAERGVRPWSCTGSVTGNGARITVHLAGPSGLVEGWSSTLEPLAAWTRIREDAIDASESSLPIRAAGAWPTVAAALESGLDGTVVARGRHGAEVKASVMDASARDLGWLGLVDRDTAPGAAFVSRHGLWIPSGGNDE